MKLNHGRHLAYCTNIHRGESWPETFDNLRRYSLAVREQVSPGKPYALGLRLSAAAARELSDPPTLLAFQRWLETERCYVFTINGFPYGQFHGAPVKEQVYVPDWTSADRLAYTNLLFDLLAKIAPPGAEGSVSTVPGSFKEFIQSPGQETAMRRNLWQCAEHIARVSDRTGRHLHLGLEPEPLCYLETSNEAIAFLGKIRDEHPNDARFQRHLGVNYDACHLAVEFEPPNLSQFEENGILVSKIHLSSALAVRATAEARRALKSFQEPVYLHQVVERGPDGSLRRFKDLDVALASTHPVDAREWRIHFHVPLQYQPASIFRTTADHLLGVLDALQRNPGLCRHLEMETYTWEVLPPELKSRDVVDQLVSEYDWCLAELTKRGLGPAQP